MTTNIDNEGDKESQEHKDIKFSQWFWKRYKKQALIITASLVLILILIYLIFAFTTPVPSGKNLTRADWLAFVGGILTLCGSILISAISITQASYFNEMEQKRQAAQRVADERTKENERLIEVKPEIAIVIEGRNLRILYIDRWPSERLHLTMFGAELPERYKEKGNSASKEGAILQQLNVVSLKQGYPVDNIWISIVNIGKYPVKHIEVYGEHYFPFLRPGEKIGLILTLDSYPRQTKAHSSIRGLETINESNSTIKVIDVRKELIDVENAHMENPKQYDYLWLDCEDVDVNSYQHTYRMHPSEVGNYFCNDEVKLTQRRKG